jgi:hypothetical protein
LLRLVLTIAARDVFVGAQEPAAAALLGIGVLREVLPPQRAEANVRLGSSCHLRPIFEATQVFRQ